MALNTVTLKWSIPDLIQSGLSGTLTITPSAEMSDTTDHELIPVYPRSVSFTGGTGQLAGVVGNDDAQILPAGTGYVISVVAENGQTIVAPFTTQILFATGAIQWLDQLATVPVVSTSFQYLPLPSGTPSSGQVPVATGTGEASAWTTLTAASVGADASGAASAALTAAEAFATAAVTTETTRAETAEALALPLAGGTMSGPVAMGSHKITGLTNGSAAQDAAAFGQIPVVAAPAGFTPGNPASTASTTLVMMGLGATCTYTPAGSGLVLVNLTGVITNSTAASNINVGPRFGTGTAPINGAAVSGTRFGGASDPEFGSALTPVGRSIAFTALLSLTPGTAYWFDVAISTTAGADAANLMNVSMTLAELP